MDICCSPWVVHQWIAVEPAFCLEAGAGQMGISCSCRLGLGSLLSSACWLLSPCNLNLERILNAGTVTDGSRVTKITWIVLVVYTSINTGGLSLYFSALYARTPTTFCAHNQNFKYRVTDTSSYFMVMLPGNQQVQQCWHLFLCNRVYLCSYLNIK